MNDEKWEDLKENIEEKFGIDSEDSEPEIMTDDIGNEIKTTRESIEFDGPSGKMKVERVTKPVILDKKMHYRKTQAGKALVEYIVSEDETTHTVKLYTWNEIENDWNELNVKSDRISF